MTFGGMLGMRFKKLICAVLIIALAAALGLAVFAANMTVTVKYDKGAQPGETFTVELVSEGCTGLAAAQFTLGFDKSVLECTSCSPGAALSGMMSASNPNASTGAIVAAASAQEVDGNGVLGVFTFKVLKSGSYGFSLSDVVFANADGTSLNYTVAGVDEVKPSATPKPTQTPAPTSTPKPTETPKPTDEPDGDTPAFTDTSGHWAEGYIARAAELGLVNGIGGGLYDPDSNMTRAHFVTILWRSAGEPEPSGSTSFIDLGSKSSYYYKAVLWAEENGYVNGVGDNLFNPNGSVTREQLVTILFRMNGEVSGGELMYSGIYEQAFTDSAKVSDWAKAALWWSVYNEIWCGTDSPDAGTTLLPQQRSTRAEIAVMMVRYMEMQEDVEI